MGIFVPSHPGSPKLLVGATANSAPTPLAVSGETYGRPKLFAVGTASSTTASLIISQIEGARLIITRLQLSYLWEYPELRFHSQSRCRHQYHGRH
jgi:hypothetical protein